MKTLIRFVLFVTFIGLIVMSLTEEKKSGKPNAGGSSGQEAGSNTGEAYADSAGDDNDRYTDGDGASRADSAGDTVDPYAYTVRNWEEYMEMPGGSQIEAANGGLRSPYIAFYLNYPGVHKATEYCVDLHVDHQPNGTYACPIDWWIDVSPLEEEYESVYNDYTGKPGGYCGFQTYRDGSRVFIMTVWDIFCEDSDGNVDLYEPEVTYPENQGQANIGNAEGSFVQCIVPYNWRPGRDYRVLLQRSESADAGTSEFTTWVCDLAENNWTRIATFDTGVRDLYFDSSGGFLENFEVDYAGDVRTMQLSNMKAKPKDSSDWVAADSVKYIFNGSIGISDYVGSANFGADGSSIWAITSGVEGLGRTPGAEEIYSLEPGDLSDPY